MRGFTARIRTIGFQFSIQTIGLFGRFPKATNNALMQTFKVLDHMFSSLHIYKAGPVSLLQHGRKSSRKESKILQIKQSNKNSSSNKLRPFQANRVAEVCQKRLVLGTSQKCSHVETTNMMLSDLLLLFFCVVQRRFPQGLKVHIQASEQHDLAALTQVLLLGLM